MNHKLVKFGGLDGAVADLTVSTLVLIIKCHTSGAEALIGAETACIPGA